MSYCSHEICKRCNEKKYIEARWDEYNRHCSDCIKDIEFIKLNNHLDELKKTMTLEQRVKRIEKLLYNLEKSGALQPPEQRKC